MPSTTSGLGDPVLKAAKNELRRKVRECWSGLSDEAKKAMNRQSYGRIVAEPCFRNAENVFLFYAEADREIVFFKDLMRNFPDKRFHFPKVKGKRLEFFEAGNLDAMKPGAFGIPEPPENRSASPEPADVVFVPAVAGDRKGRRLGRGGGFYDRWLESPTRSTKICVLPSFAVFDRIPFDPRCDRKFDLLVEIESPETICKPISRPSVEK